METIKESLSGCGDLIISNISLLWSRLVWLQKYEKKSELSADMW